MIVVVPNAIPLYTPDAEPMVAIPVLLLLQRPTPDASLMVVFCPMQPIVAPDMPAGNGLTVTIPPAEFTGEPIGIHPTVLL